ncbi:REP element-mobilizing transposase RayT [Flavobacterium sp. CF108]|uniref:IS200/IS605 family transposase n=1 Tax=unclassified Flavobacterium TaxID=196869 RepID=UPI0008B54391|nr:MULTISPECIES: IS200/IS605 family transposase [unclassified Flavobacterium]SEO91520.1 REP element-mobilizing transposase RayT [Flavobacterium sp. fv08]SHH84860.1 REP element-mobilizing transposase RayT [Flavobacterium sp. CF108]
MANTYTQIHIHFVFAVKYRQAVIHTNWKNDLYKYISGIIKNNNHKVLAINGVSDHIHILIGIRPAQSITELMKSIKQNSSKWINENKFTNIHFEWQEGYGAFSYSKSQLSAVSDYIENQEEHHKKKTFKEEYINFLEKFEVDYDEKFIFKELI